MSALHLTARRQTGRMHVCTGITESVASKYIILSLPLSFFHSFPLSHSTLNHSKCFCKCFFLHLSSNLLCFLVIIYNNYDLFPIQSFRFSFFFFFSFDLLSKKRIKKDFVIAASKCNEMLSLPSMHEFVLFKLIFFYIGLYRFYTEQNYLLRKFR